MTTLAPMPGTPRLSSFHEFPPGPEIIAVGGGFVLSTGGHGKSQLRPFPSSTSRDSCPGWTPAGGQQESTPAAGTSGGPGVQGEGVDPVSSDETFAGPADSGEPGFGHVPVMVGEIVDLFAEVPPGLIVDATLGGGGHSEALLASRPDIRILGLDRDPAALAAARDRLARFGDRFAARHLRFDHIGEVLEGTPATGILFDLGVSSHQLDRPERGFSYRRGGPLDMRMDPTSSLTATQVVNTYEERELARVLRANADERFASRIARAIVGARPINDTAHLAATIVSAIPAAARRSGPHPATRSFQAIRIEVNSELEVLAPALEAAIDGLIPGGRMAVLSYHSGEDRIVKSVLREASRTSPRGRPDLPTPPGFSPRLKLLRRVGRRPSEAETAANPRSTSARLRAAERI